MQRDNWGWRARIGMFIVASEAVPEAEWWAMTPAGVSVHAARVEARHLGHGDSERAKWNSHPIWHADISFRQHAVECHRDRS